MDRPIETIAIAEGGDDMDLKSAVRNALNNRGTISELRARIRAEIYHVLENKDSIIKDAPSKPHDVYLAYELIREMLMSFGLNNSASVFMEESGSHSSEMQVNREFLASELGMRTNDSQDGDIPLLLLIIRMLKEMRAERIDGLALPSEQSENI